MTDVAPPGASSAAAVTVCFADISGSTLLYAVRGDEVAYRLTSTCLNLLAAQVTAAGGRVVKRLGDAVLALFETPTTALKAAIGMQHALEAPDCPVRDEGVHVRAGIATGSAVLEADDVYGDVVNIAARLVSLAGAGEIFLAGETFEGLPAELKEPVRLIDQLALRGRPSWVLVYQFLWKEENATVSVGQRRREASATLEVLYGAARFVVGPTHPRLTIGREADNDVAIDEEVVSRRHAEIVLRGDKFLLVDRSTNGTFVYSDAGDVFRLTREELTLAGSGRIVPGRDTLAPLRYRLGSG